jgi:ATP-dependent helicase/nuclease subunit B
MAAPKTFLDTQGPRVFTLPSSQSFLDHLAQGIQQAAGEASPYGLSDAMILTPTRRAARGLVDAFAQASGSTGTLLLPRIAAIGDLDADEPPFAPGEIALQSLRALSGEQKWFALTALVQARLRAEGKDNTFIAALAEADALGRLIDEAHTEGVSSFDVAKEEFAQKLEGQAEHVQRAARFLDIVMQYWPAHLQEINACDPAAYRVFSLDALAQKWRDSPPDHMVIAAGSTGSVPATARLLTVIAGLPKGAVILPGLDESLSDEDWKAVEQSPGHPQYGMARLLREMGLKRGQIAPWPGTREGRQARLRRRLVNEALLPAQATAGWSERLERLARDETVTPQKLVKEAMTGLSLIEAQNEEEEALVLALAIRNTLEDPQKTAILVTPDRALAERVRVALWRWNIHIDNSAGIPLDTMPTGVFLSLIAHGAGSPVDPLVLASLLGTNLARMGMDGPGARHHAQALEARFLRGAQRHENYTQLRQGVEQAEPENKPLATYAQVLEQAFLCFDTLETAPVAKWAKAHAKAAQHLAQSDEKSGDERLWKGRSGSAAASILRALMEDADALGAISRREYANLYDTLAHQRPIRPQGAAQARARILGPLEARMMSADLVALGGLNEGVWPSLPTQDPFLPRHLRLALKLPDPERRLGLAAHDFAEHASKANVLLTRAKRKGTEPAIASRWLWRLQTLLQCAEPTPNTGTNLLASDLDYLALARSLDRVAPGDIHPARAPAPKPPLTLRPRALYVTRLKTLIRNPYAIYGRFILNLMPLDALGENPSHKERGSAVHDALERFIGGPMAPDHPDALNTLTALMVAALREAGFAEHQIPAERARMKRAAKWVLGWQIEREKEGWTPAMLEGQGTLNITTKGGEFTIKAYADRIDRGGQGFAVLDYKTGAPPGTKEVYAGFDPQLPLEAAILEHAGFTKEEKTIRGKADSLVYVRVSGGSKPGEMIRLGVGRNDKINISAAEFQQRAMDDLHKLINWFDNPQNPYLSQPRAKYTDSYSDYDLLARRPEWAATAENDEGGEP